MNSGAFSENFPYSNFHDLNMDWIIKIAKDFLDQYTHIQDTINEGLEDLDEKAQDLEDALQAWYDDHSEDIANQLAQALVSLGNALQANIQNLNENANMKLAEVLAEIPADYTDLSNMVELLRKANAYRIPSNVPAINYNLPVYENDVYVFRLSSLSDSTKKITLYGVYNDGTEHTEGIVQISENLTTVKFARNYEKLRFSVTPYSASWTGSYSIDILAGNSDLYNAINRLNYIEPANVSDITVNGAIYISNIPLNAGDEIAISLKSISDNTKRVTVYGMVNGQATALLALTSTPQMIFTKQNFDYLQFAISPYDASWNGTYVVEITKNTLISQIVNSNFNTYTQVNTAVINTLIKPSQGDYVAFDVHEINGTDNKLRIYGIYHNGNTEQSDVLITAFIKDTIYIAQCTRDYEYLRITFSPYLATFTGNFTYSIKTEKSRYSFNIPFHCISKLQEDTQKLISFNNLPKVFKKVVCCGDSYTSGHIQLPGQSADPYNEEFAWPHFMATKTGNNWINCGSSGATTWTWLERAGGLAKAQQQGYSQAYVVGLMINDQQSGAQNIPLGTSSDIGTENRTYYAGMSKIIRELNAISPLAKIFVNTCPKHGENYADYNNAVRDIVEAYKNTYPVFLIDLERDYFQMYQNPSLTNDYLNGHYTALGYEQFADIYNWVLSDYMSKNIAKFQNVHKIPYT